MQMNKGKNRFINFYFSLNFGNLIYKEKDEKRGHINYFALIHYFCCCYFTFISRR